MFLWDYDRKTLEKTASRRLLILERKINYSPGDEKIKISEVKKIGINYNYSQHVNVYLNY